MGLPSAPPWRPHDPRPGGTLRLLVRLPCPLSSSRCSPSCFSLPHLGTLRGSSSLRVPGPVLFTAWSLGWNTWASSRRDTHWGGGLPGLCARPGSPSAPTELCVPSAPPTCGAAPPASTVEVPVSASTYAGLPPSLWRGDSTCPGVSAISSVCFPMCDRRCPW